jgi:hypothetical protein
MIRNQLGANDHHVAWRVDPQPHLPPLQSNHGHADIITDEQLLHELPRQDEHVSHPYFTDDSTSKPGRCRTRICRPIVRLHGKTIDLKWIFSKPLLGSLGCFEIVSGALGGFRPGSTSSATPARTYREVERLLRL